jgi:hypothetical protein
MYGSDFRGDSLFRSRVRWGAVLAGVISGMVVQVILSLLGMAIGFQALDPGNMDTNAQGVGIGSGFWLLISALISGFAGGWVASSLANINRRLDGLMHGILSWGVFMIIAAYLMGTGLGKMVGGGFNLASSALTGASQGVAISATRGEGVAAVREEASENQGQINQLQQQATQAARSERTADAAAGATWGVFFVALLSLLASAFGGLLGLKSHDYTDTRATI